MGLLQVFTLAVKYLQQLTVNLNIFKKNDEVPPKKGIPAPVGISRIESPFQMFLTKPCWTH